MDVLGVLLWLTMLALTLSAVVDPLAWPFSAVYLGHPLLMGALLLRADHA